jgi:hypothetical protein
MHKEYFQIFKDIVHRIDFDYHLRKYKENVVHGKINWHDTLRNNPIGFSQYFCSPYLIPVSGIFLIVRLATNF